jgi:hypothetical protein
VLLACRIRLLSIEYPPVVPEVFTPPVKSDLFVVEVAVK